MDQRTLGAIGINCSVLGFGCAPVGSRCGRAESLRALNLAFDRGVTLFDTADMYGVGASERILGEFLRDGNKRDKVVIASKCGYTFSQRLRAVSWVKPLLRPLVRKLKGVKSSAGAIMASQRSQCFDAAYVERCVNDSLSRLGVNHIDVFFLHDPAAAIVQSGEALGVLERLKQAGKLRAIGVSSEHDAVLAALRRAGSPVDVIQAGASVADISGMEQLLDEAAAKQAGFIARQPFANGCVLGSKLFLDGLAASGIAANRDEAAAIAVRFVLGYPGVSAVLPGMMTPAHIEANVAAANRGPLSPDVQRRVAELARSAMGGSGGLGAA